MSGPTAVPASVRRGHEPAWQRNALLLERGKSNRQVKQADGSCSPGGEPPPHSLTQCHCIDYNRVDVLSTIAVVINTSRLIGYRVAACDRRE